MSTEHGVICFDLGGVIIRTCASWEEACRAAGLEYRPVVDTAEVQERIRRVDLLHQAGRMTDDEFFREIARAIGGVCTPEEIDRIHDAWLLGEYAGFQELISELNDRGLPTACLSNTNQRHWELMEGRRSSLVSAAHHAFPAFRNLRHRHASHLLGMLKPSPEIYRKFATTLAGELHGHGGEEISPESIVFFDDREENVAAAVAAGWRATRIDPSGDTAGQIRRVLRGLSVI
jgi:FMN phosphatase YigB (HAD superfamily)